jgi:hypothetical protein
VIATPEPSSFGLSEAEAERRLLARGPLEPPQTSRSYASIVRANVFTSFNLILAILGALTLVFGDWRNALFLGILVANSGIGKYIFATLCSKPAATNAAIGGTTARIRSAVVRAL